MGAYTFISSRDPVDGDQLVHELASQLATAGHDVTLFLVENGAFLARSGAADGLLASVQEAGVTVLADDFALAERGITGAGMSKGVTSSSLSVLVDHLAAGRKVAWH
jgi:predicted peroxiredoxin